MIVVYVCGPISGRHGDNQFANVHAALIAGHKLRQAGYVALVPHRGFIDEIALGPQGYEVWMAEDFELIRRCDLLVRLPGESSGSDREVAFAREIGKSVYFGVEAFLNAHPKQTEFSFQGEFGAERPVKQLDLFAGTKGQE